MKLLPEHKIYQVQLTNQTILVKYQVKDNKIEF